MAGAVPDFDRFCETYLQAWEARSTVRTMVRFRPGVDAAAVDLMPDFFVPSLRDPELQSLSAEARNFVLTQKTYSFLEAVARNETDTVTAIAMEAANNAFRVDIPRLARQTLLTVAVDEPYHAFAAREFMAEIVRIKGIEPISECFPEHDHHHLAFRRAEQLVPAELKADFRVITICLVENLITDEVLDFTRSTAEESPVHWLNKEHMIDEGRHSEFFRRLLRHYWSGLESEVRQALAPAVATLIDGMNAVDDYQAFDFAALVAAGVQRETAEEVTSRPSEFDKRHSRIWKNTLRALTKAGLLDDPRVVAVLDDHGWLEKGDGHRD